MDTMKLTLTLSLALSMLCTISSNSFGSTLKYYNCGSRISPVTVKEVFLEPDPAVSGENMTFVITALANVDISGGSVGVLVQYYGIPVYFETDSLCSKTSKCPLEAGDNFVFTNSQLLPGISPPGPYSVRIRVTDSNSKELFCEKMEFKITKQSVSSWFHRLVLPLFKSQASNVGDLLDAADRAFKLGSKTMLQLKAALYQAKDFAYSHPSSDREDHWDSI